jgi:DNA-binding CsgD family transcriptional regulator
MGASHLREGDADLLWELVQDARHDDPGTPVPWALLEGLQRLIPCDVYVSFQHHDYGQLRSLVIQGVDEDGRHETVDLDDPSSRDERFWQHWWQGPCSWPQRTGDLHSVRLSTDLFPTERDRLADPSHDGDDVRYDMCVSLPAAPGEARRFEFMRIDGPPFSERDRNLLTLLRPHLIEICLHAERRRAGVPPLTPREWEVLALAGAGLPYDDIARQLVVSRGTVRKHMENVRARLGVHSIGAAVALALPHAPSAPSLPAETATPRRVRTG